MSYFSRIQLDTTHPEARTAMHQLLKADAYEDHRLLWQFFPAPSDAERDFVFRRMEADGRNGVAQFYAVSKRTPEQPHPAWTVESKPYDPQPEVGQELAFDIRINPVQSHQRNGAARRDDVVMHAKHQLARHHGYSSWSELPVAERPPLYELVRDAVCTWFCGGDPERNIAARNGFAADPERLRVDGYRQHRLHRKQTDIQLSTVDISGFLTVQNPSHFVAALHNGIGKAKAFGCGLMLVRRP